MKELYLTEEQKGISEEQLTRMLEELAAQYPDARKVLIIPPDYTRCHSYAGEITRILYQIFGAREEKPQVDVMPGLGTHMPMSEEEIFKFFGGVVPPEAVLVHRWQTDTVTVGYVPKEVLAEISGGLYVTDVEVELDYRVVNGGYDVIFSVGQVVPHEAAGMANYSKNLFIGVGGREMINKSHMLSSICGVEQAMGVTDSPLRKMYDYAQREFVDGKLPVVFLQTVTTREEGTARLNGLYIGASRTPFEKAAALSQKLNITHLDRQPKKVVTYLDPEELKTVWVGNKGIYRTRLAIADGGELLILAPGVTSFGENEEIDQMIRRFGYRGRDVLLQHFNAGEFGESTMGAGHLIISSSEGRFQIIYATDPEKLGKEDFESVGYGWMDIREAMARYNPEKLEEGWNVMPDGEEIYYIGNPALGLWQYDGDR